MGEKMNPEKRRVAEAWYQALRAWKTRRLADTIPSGPKRTPGGIPARVARGCPVCSSARAAEWDEQILEARAHGEDLTPVVRGIAQALHARETLVWLHARDHLDPEPPRPVIGEWAYDRRVHLGEHLLTPAGWIPTDRVLATIREAPEDVRVRLDWIRMGRRLPRSLLDGDEQFKDKKRRLLAEAVLWLAEALSPRRA